MTTMAPASTCIHSLFNAHFHFNHWNVGRQAIEGASTSGVRCGGFCGAENEGIDALRRLQLMHRTYTQFKKVKTSGICTFTHTSKS